MLQSRKELLLSAIKKNNIKGIINLGLRYLETNNESDKVHYSPPTVQVEITTLCNLKCTMCNHTYMQETGGNMNLESFKKFIESNPHLQKINITGIGEALMNRDFIEMVKYAKQKGIYVWFTDNMTLMNEKNIQKLLDAKVDLICISLDGATKKTFEKIRIGANFENLLENTKKILKMRDGKRPLIGINMVVTKDNYQEIEKMVKLVHELRLDFLTFMTGYFGSKETLPLSLDSISKEELDKIIAEGVKTAKELEVFVISWPKTQKSEKTGCSMPWTNPYVTYNGDVLPCCFIPQELDGRKRDENIMGNIFKEDFKIIWNNEKFTSFRKRMKTSDPPKSCKICPNFYGLS